MNMPEDVAKWLIFYLHILNTDALSPQFLLGGDIESYPPKTQLKQQLTADMIYRLLKCGLVAITPEDWLELTGLHSIEGFARELVRVDESRDIRPGDPDYRQHAMDLGVWMDPQLYCTEVGRALVNRYFPIKLDIEDNSSVARFNQEICGLFERNAVPWSDAALIRD